MNRFRIHREQALQKWEQEIAHSDLPVIYLGTASCGIAALDITSRLPFFDLFEKKFMLAEFGPCRARF